MRVLFAVLRGILLFALELPLYLLLFIYSLFWMGSGFGIFLLPTPRPFWRDPGFWVRRKKTKFPNTTTPNGDHP